MSKSKSNSFSPFIAVYAGIGGLMLLLALLISLRNSNAWNLPLFPSLKVISLLLIALAGLLGAYNYFKGKKERSFKMLASYLFFTSIGFTLFGVDFKAYSGLIIAVEWNNVWEWNTIVNYSVLGVLKEVRSELIGFSVNLVHLSLFIFYIKKGKNEQ